MADDVVLLEADLEQEPDEETEEGSADPGELLSGPAKLLGWLGKKAVKAAQEVLPEDDTPPEGEEEETEP